MEHVKDKKDFEGDSTVQASRNLMGMVSQAGSDTNPRGLRDCTVHKEEFIRERTTQHRPNACSSVEMSVEIRDPKRMRGEKQVDKESREVRERGTICPLTDNSRGGEDSSSKYEPEKERGKQQALDLGRKEKREGARAEGEYFVEGDDVGRPIEYCENFGSPSKGMEPLNSLKGKPTSQFKEQDPKGESKRGKGPTDNMELPMVIPNLQEAIAVAMKEAMAAQLKDWFGAGKGNGTALAMKEAKENRDDILVKETEFEESGSRESHCPSRVVEEEQLRIEGDKETGEGSYTRIAVEACEQLSREREMKAITDNKKEAEVVSPVTT